MTKWKKEFNLDHVDVQLVVVDNFESDETRSLINQWAIKEGVEIIDFSEDEEDENSSENREDQVHIFASDSQKRIVEALQVWVLFAQFAAKDSKNESICINWFLQINIGPKTYDFKTPKSNRFWVGCFNVKLGVENLKFVSNGSFFQCCAKMLHITAHSLEE